MALFVGKDSIVRQIWGKGDTILFIFAGASAEFALNKAVDWLYFTGRLPADPLGRLFSTVSYARQIVFSDFYQALYAIDKINAIHKNVEASRERKIPDWAYRDVLSMLIDYSVRSFEVLERKLSEEEKAEIFDVFYRVGMRMEITGLPQNYNDWEIMREKQLNEDLLFSEFTADLYKQYRKHLGLFRFILLKQAQVLVAPRQVQHLLKLGTTRYLIPVLKAYRIAGVLGLDKVLRNLILPKIYKSEIESLDRNNSRV